MYLAVSEGETLIGNLREKYQTLSYLCRWVADKKQTLCRESEIGVTKLLLAVPDRRKLWEYETQTPGRAGADRPGDRKRIPEDPENLSRRKRQYSGSGSKMLPSPEYGGISSEKRSVRSPGRISGRRETHPVGTGLSDPESAETAGINKAE